MDRQIRFVLSLSKDGHRTGLDPLSQLHFG